MYSLADADIFHIDELSKQGTFTNKDCGRQVKGERQVALACQARGRRTHCRGYSGGGFYIQQMFQPPPLAAQFERQSAAYVIAGAVHEVD